MPTHVTKLIVNPNADLGRAWRNAADLRPIIEEYGGADWSGTVYPTHATELARQAGLDGYQLVVAVGGDGTAHEVVNGLMQLPPEIRPRLGIVPLGSGNDFSHAIGLDQNPAIALRQTLTGTPHRIDIGLLSDEHGRKEYWDNTLGIGFDTTVTIRSRRLTWIRGFLRYFIAVVQTILMNHDAPLMKIDSDLEKIEQKYLMLTVCNGPREGGGFLVAPKAVMDDGQFEYVAISHISRLMMFRLLPEVMRGTHGRFKAVHTGQMKHLSLEANQPLYIHTDGEIFAGFGVDIRKLQIEIIPAALEIIR